MYFLIGVIILILFIIFCYFYIKRKIKNIVGNIDFKEVMKVHDEEIPRSLSSMDSLYLKEIKKDFPDLNINELKSKVEKYILEIHNCIESKSINKKIDNEKVKEYIKARIDDSKNIDYKDIKIHKTVVSKYKKEKGVCTIVFATAFEIREDDIKKQKRIDSELIYVYDSSKTPDNIKSFGINCPNCGAPIKTLNHKSCSYCGSGVIDIVKKTFVLNNIKEL